MFALCKSLELSIISSCFTLRKQFCNLFYCLLPKGKQNLWVCFQVLVTFLGPFLYASHLLPSVVVGTKSFIWKLWNNIFVWWVKVKVIKIEMRVCFGGVFLLLNYLMNHWTNLNETCRKLSLEVFLQFINFLRDIWCF